MSTKDDDKDRRRFQRVKLPILCRPTGVTSGNKPVIDMGLGGVRVFSDEPAKLGQRLEIDLFLPDDDTTLTCKVVVAWVQELEKDAPARYDVGLEFFDVEPGDLDRLATIIRTGR